jgi:hypothetical protein
VATQPHTCRFLTKREPLLESEQVNFLALADCKLPVAPSTLRSSSWSTEAADPGT